MSFRNKDTGTGKALKDEFEEIEYDNEQDVGRIKDDTTQDEIGFEEENQSHVQS